MCTHWGFRMRAQIVSAIATPVASGPSRGGRAVVVLLVNKTLALVSGVFGSRLVVERAWFRLGVVWWGGSVV